MIPTKVVDKSARMETIPRWFQGIRINMAENVLYGSGKQDSKIAVTSIREGNTSVLHTSWAELRELVGRLASAMRAAGVRKGDRVAAIASNCLNTLVVFLGTISLGAIFTSTSTDMGTKGVLDRLMQIRPCLIFMEDFGVYAGKVNQPLSKMVEVIEGVQSIQEFKLLVSMPRFEQPADISGIPRRSGLEPEMSKALSDG